MRLIDAEALEEDFYDNYDKKGYRNGKSLIYAAWCLLKKLIEKAPTIEAKPVVRAHWERSRCSNCKRNLFELFDAGSHLIESFKEEVVCCPFCGAQMDEDASDNNVRSKTEKVSE